MREYKYSKYRLIMEKKSALKNLYFKLLTTKFLTRKLTNKIFQIHYSVHYQL